MRMSQRALRRHCRTWSSLACHYVFGESCRLTAGEPLHMMAHYIAWAACCRHHVEMHDAHRRDDFSTSSLVGIKTARDRQIRSYAHRQWNVIYSSVSSKCVAGRDFSDKADNAISPHLYHQQLIHHICSSSTSFRHGKALLTGHVNWLETVNALALAT